MEYVLAIIFVMILSLIFYLANKIHVDREEYKKRLNLMKKFILDLNYHQEIQNQQVQLSNEFKERLKKITSEIYQDIFDLNYYLFEENYQKKK